VVKYTHNNLDLAGGEGAGNTNPATTFADLSWRSVPMAASLAYPFSAVFGSRFSRRFRRLLTNAILAPLVTPEVR
jgi:hypothetical protein